MAEESTARPDLMTTREVAELLRLKERKIYDLVSTGEIPHVRVTGKILFPRGLVDTWLYQRTQYAAGADVLREPANVIAGSHDPLLSWALGESAADLPALFDSSVDGLKRMQSGTAIAAGIHLREDDGYNCRHIERFLAGQPVVAVEWAKRTQGLIVAAGNPLRIRQVGDLAGRRLVPRQQSAGSFVLLRHVLQAVGMSLDDLNVAASPARSESELARMIGNGDGDAGLGLEAMALAHGLGFVPLADERYDLVIWRRAWFEPPLQALMQFAKTPAFAQRAAEFAGYDLTGAGTVHFNGP